MAIMLTLAWVVGVGQVELIRTDMAMVLRVGDGYTVRTYLKDDGGFMLESFSRAYAFDTCLVGLFNGGMFMEDLRPLGLYVEGGKVIREVNRRQGSTNFYMEPNGIFGVTWLGHAAVISTASYTGEEGFAYATQSGPMVVIDGKVNPKFNRWSESVNRRSGVGIRTDGVLVFILTNESINFYDFAQLFIAEGCMDALHLDSCISGLWYGERDYGSSDGFGPMIGVRRKGDCDE